MIKGMVKLWEKRALKIEKRVRLVISVVLLSGAMLFASFFNLAQAIYFLPLLLFLTYFLTYFSLLEGIKKMSWYGLFLMPVVTSLSFFLFYYLFPTRWLTRLPFITIYAISLYAVILCSNIFNVGVEKSLGLYRAAFSINFFFQTLVIFFAFMFMASLKEFFWFNFLGGGIISFFLSGQLFWTIKLDKHLDKGLLGYSALIGLLLAELSLLCSFIPFGSSIFAIFLTSIYYSLTGLVYNFIDQKLFKETIREYLLVLVFVFIVVVLSVSWR